MFSSHIFPSSNVVWTAACPEKEIYNLTKGLKSYIIHCHKVR